MMVLKVVIVLMAVASYASVANGLCCDGCPLSGGHGVLMVPAALPSAAVQLVLAISSVAAVVVCAVKLPFFRAYSLWLRLKLTTLM